MAGEKYQINEDGFKITDAGNIPNAGRIALYWRENRTKLEKFTQAKAFNKDVQLNQEEYIKYFGFKGIEFGNWTSQEDRTEFLFGSAHAFEFIRKYFNIPADWIGLNGELAISYGARGSHGNLAHYEPSRKVINITKPHDRSGSLFHEYAHAIDFIAYEYLRKKYKELEDYKACSGGYTTTKAIDKSRLKRKDIVGEAENIIASLYYNIDSTQRKWLKDFKKSKLSNSDYWNRRIEVFARASEVYFSLVSKNHNITNYILTQQKYEHFTYPDIETIKDISYLFDDFYTEAFTLINSERKYEPIKEKKNIMAKGNHTEISTQTENIKAKYELMELSKLVPSNDPFTFAPSENYPKDCQTRNYLEVKGEQEKVIKYATNFKPEHLINTSPDATTGSPVVTEAGIVLGGNGRTMILKRITNPSWEKYQNLLKQKLSDFGISEKKYNDFKEPVLVRVIENVPNNKCSFYSDQLNTNTMQSYDPIQKSISIAKSIDSETFTKIAKIFESADGDTFNQMLSIGSVEKNIVKILLDKKIINTSNRDVWLNDNRLSNTGKELIENILLAYILPDKKLINKAKIYSNKIAKALPQLVVINQYKGKWNLIPDIQNVIEHENKRRSSNQSKADFLKQFDVFSTKKEIVSDRHKYIWELLDSGLSQFKNKLSSFIRTYENENSSNKIFDSKPADPDDVLSNLVSKNGISDKRHNIRGKNNKAKHNYSKSIKTASKQKYESQNLADKPKTVKRTKKPAKKVRLTFLDRFFGVTK